MFGLPDKKELKLLYSDYKTNREQCAQTPASRLMVLENFVDKLLKWILE